MYSCGLVNNVVFPFNLPNRQLPTRTARRTKAQSIAWTNPIPVRFSTPASFGANTKQIPAIQWTRTWTASTMTTMMMTRTSIRRKRMTWRQPDQSIWYFRLVRKRTVHTRSVSSWSRTSVFRSDWIRDQRWRSESRRRKESDGWRWVVDSITFLRLPFCVSFFKFSQIS